MKKAFKLLFLLPVLSLAICSSAQRYEFHEYDNGLIYPDSALAKLKPIADSLQLAFPKVALNKAYRSQLHIKAHFVSFSNNKPQVLAAIKDILANIPFHQFEQKYPDAEIEKELLVIKSKYIDYQKKKIAHFSSIQPGKLSSRDLYLEDSCREYNTPLKGKWLCHYDTTGISPSFHAFYCVEEFSPKPLPAPYARMIQYATYLTDTMAVFYNRAPYIGEEDDYDSSSAIYTFISYMHLATQKPSTDSMRSSNYYDLYNRWNDAWDMRIDSLEKNDPQFSILLAEAIKNALLQGGGDYELEACAAYYYNKKIVLELKRNHNIMGANSIDQGPRRHALEIATLSAETQNWPVFLRCHLNLLNDDFVRRSDYSYYAEKRNTFIKELEEFNIHVTDLLLGITLSIDNPGNHHYHGNLMRIGRALSETSQPAEVENKLLQMISDKHLDDYNRVQMYCVFTSYNEHMKDKARKALNRKKLLAAIKTLPAYLAQQLRIPDNTL